VHAEAGKNGTTGGDGLALIVVDRAGEILLAEGSSVAALSGSDDPAGQRASAVFGERAPMRAAIDSALSGHGMTVSLEAEGHTYEVAVEPRREGGAVIAAIDETKRTHHDAQRRDADRQFDLIFRQVPGAVWTTDRALRVTHAFGRIAAELRLARASMMVGLSVYDVAGTRDDTDATVRAHRAALSGERSAYRYTFRGRTFEMLTEPLRDDKKEIVGTVSAAIDVTRALANERRLRDAQRVAHVGSWEWDVVQNKVSWSDEMYCIYGVSPDDFAGSFEGFLSRVMGDDLEETKRVVFGAFKSPGPFVFDHRIIRPDGDVRMLHTRGDVIVNDAGKPIRMIGSCWDITERWRTARALERSNSLLRATLDATADGIMVVDSQGQKVTAYNRKFVEMWCLPPDLLEDGDASAFLAVAVDQVDDPDGFLEGVRKLQAEPERDAFDVIRFRDGRTFERVSRPQRLGNEIVGRVWSCRDITDRERSFRRATFLADAGRLLSSLDVEQALSSVANLAVPYLGDMCAIDLLGEGPPRRLLAVAGDRTFTPDLSPTVLTGRSSIYTAAARAHMAVPLMVEGLVTGAITLAAARGRRYSQSDVEVAEELARRVSLALDKSHLLQRAQEALRAREEFLAIAAHEIRGPVTSMHAAVQALLRRKLPDAANKRALELIEREDRRLARFVDELLDLGMAHSPSASIELDQVSLARVVRDTVSRDADEIARSGSAVSMDLDEKSVGTWGHDRIEKVVAALLSNAIKFGLGKPIEISVRGHGGRATLRVLDHGIGISKSAQQRIFSPFERAVSVRHYGGLGLGLYIASSLVREVGGTITVESEPGVGSIFTVELPGRSEP